jgi:purine-nucleoside/S-methyl-5'-thioadenosine phosphorylase / adenosine deaminase
MILKNSSHLSTRNAQGHPPVASEVPFFEFPSLSVYPELAHFVFTRHGGVSDATFRSLNVSFSTGDSAKNVETNLSMIQQITGARSLRFMNQVHGNNIVILRESTVRGVERVFTADAMITDLPGTALLVKQADCQAVILYDPARKVVSNVHCGWRGNVNGLLSAVVAAMGAEFGCDPSGLRAAIGPSLGPCCAEFVTHQEIFPGSFRSFMVRENYFDLWAISRSQLVASGLKGEHIESADWCTRCRTDLFYSYRAEGQTGRFATVAMLKPGG